MAYTADVNRWRGPADEDTRPHMRIHPGMVIGTILGFLFWWPVGLAFLFFAAIGVVVQLKDAFNIVWASAPRTSPTTSGRDRSPTRC